MPDAWAGTILRVNLTERTFEEDSTERYLEDFLGGKGINTKILWDEVGPEVKPFDPENRLIFGVGPLVGTIVPGSCRCSVTSKSPQSGIFGDSNFGGYWGPELKFAGYDHIVITGRSEEPVYLWISNGVVELKEASHLWGKDTIETQRLIREERNDKETQVACIGPAGENKVCFASINHDLGNGASRVGLGAVMGSKNLKAIAVRGTGDIMIARPSELANLCTEIMTARPEPEMRLMAEDLIRRGGVIPGVLEPGIFAYGSHDDSPVREIVENQERSVMQYYEEHLSRMESCYNCPSPCKFLVEVPDTDARIVIKCETNQTMPVRLKICDYPFNVKTVLRCYQLGLDLFSAASSIAFLMDLREKGIITDRDTDGIPMKWRDGEAALRMLEKIAKREGCGARFAQGTLKAAESIGGEAEKYVYHTKGVEWISYSHYHPENALASAVSERGCSLRSGSGTLMALVRILPGILPGEALEPLVKANFPSNLWQKVVDADEYEGKADLLEYQERVGTHIPDMLGVCKFLSGWLPFYFFHFDDMSKLLSFATGKEVDAEMLSRFSERMASLTRAYNVREGISRANDTVTDILFEKPSPVTGRTLSRKKFDEQLDRYYELHGWDNEGVPKRSTLLDLGLSYVADSLEGAKRENL